MARLNTRSQNGTKQDDPRARASTRQRLTERYVSPPPATMQERLRAEEALARTMTGKKKTKTLFDESPLASEKTPSTSSTSLRRSKTTKSRTKALAEQQFDIFADSDGTTERDTPKPKKETPLKLARTNSMILPLPQQHHQPRARTSRKSELYNYDKENDPLEEELDPDMDSEATTSLSRNPSDASTSASSVRTSPARRRNATQQQQQQQFTRYRQPSRNESEDENENEEDSFNSLDDFIVSDDDEPSFHESSSENESEEEEHKASPQPPTPPTQRRRLFRGRRPNPAVEIENALRESARRPDLRLEPSLPASFTVPSTSPKLDSVSRKLFQKDTDMSEEMDRLKLDDRAPSSQLQDDLFGAVSGLESPTDARPQSPFQTPPSSPTKSLLRSPTKDRIMIPPTPHRESTDAFWSLEVTNNWIDSHSPRKITSLLKEFDQSDEDSETIPKRSRAEKPAKPLSKTALKKAETEAKKAAIARKKSFDNRKVAFADDFLKALDDAVSGGEVQKRAAETGGVRIVWSKTLQTTAGRANWRRDRAVVDSEPVTPARASPGNETPPVTTKHYATIELAERIIDDEDRLINTLAHEYCHLANYMISNVRNQPHGVSFQAWGRKCKEALQDHPVYGGRIEVTTRHSYKIDYKYVWTCVDCCQNYGRHSKSIDPGKHRCGKCKGLLQQIKPKPRSVSPRKKQPAGVVNDVAKDLEVIDLSP
ncbi:SprT-like family-domain-containing protein [Aspergillus unguis]